MSAFGDEIKRLASEKGLTQKDIADVSGVAQSFIGKLIRGEQAAPRADALYRLCKALGVSCDHFQRFLAPDTLDAEEPAVAPVKKGATAEVLEEPAKLVKKKRK